MIKRMSFVIAAILFCLAAGCSSAKHGAKTRTADEPSVPESAGLDPRSIAALRDRIDSAAALYAFGEIAEFVAARDSLRARIDSLAIAQPGAVDQPEFAELVEDLAELDSLYPAGLGHAYLAEEDSLALSAGAWPEDEGVGTTVPPSKVDDSPFPYLVNDRIEFWIRYFTGPGKERFERALYRMELHRPTIERILEEQGLHPDLICVALIESGFNLKARSYAKAVGPWQFIAGTARLYGLRVDWWYDERRDIVASTYAAINYLEDLHALWNDWLLALASYNCGEYRVARAVARHKTRDFWELDLPKQTERYVPKFLAALYIVREPEKYGLVIPEVEPVEFDEVTIKDATDLKVIAGFAETTAEYLADLNPALLRWCTPPQMEVSVKVPKGAGDGCANKLAAIPPEERVTWRKHQIRSGETLSLIANRYHTTVSTLKSLNRIKNAHSIRAGNVLIVPVQGPYIEVASAKPQYKEARRTIDKAALENYTKRFEPPADHRRVTYVVKRNDTLGEIAELYDTSAKKIRQWNNLSSRAFIYPGQKLAVYVPETFDVPTAAAVETDASSPDTFVTEKYTVRKGDTFYSISRKFNVGITELLAWNGKSARSVIHPGEVVEIRRKRG
jgi:membrane-bound lytic murein transglycosylase D